MGGAQRVCIVDDQPEVLWSLGRLLTAAGFIVRTFPAAHDFLADQELECSACVILDINLPEMDGLELQAELSRRHVDSTVIFLSGHATIRHSVQAMKAGAFDFLTKPVDAETLIATVHAGLAQHSRSSQQRHELTALEQRWATLTPREQQVFRLVASGMLNKEVAASLGTAEKTIKVHRGRAMRKMHARRVSDLVRMAEQLHNVINVVDA